jgi:hypothetical protein
MDRSTAALGMFLAATLACEVAAAQSYDHAGATALDSGLQRAQIERTEQASSNQPPDNPLPRHAGAIPTAPVPGPRSMCSDPLAALQSEQSSEGDGAAPANAAVGELVPATGAPSVSPLLPTPRPTSPTARLEPSTTGEPPAALPGAAPDDREGSDVPWCVSSDDPRCAPIGGGGAPVQVEGRTPVSGLCARVTEPAWPTGDMVFSARTGSHPRAGVSFRIERPPRRR